MFIDNDGLKDYKQITRHLDYLLNRKPNSVSYIITDDIYQTYKG